MEAIKVESLTKNYHKKRAIENVNLTVNEGELYGFIGPNGAGKSTTIKVLLNFIYATSGGATVLGKDVVKNSAEIKKMVGYVPSEVRYYPQMTANDIIHYAAKFHHIENATKKMNNYFEMFSIDPKKIFGEMSLGNKKKVAIVAGLITEPKLFILDEPTNGLDPLMQHYLFKEMTDRNKEGMTIFLSSHNLREVQEYCTRAAFIRNGNIIAVEDILNQQMSGKVIALKGSNLPLEKLISAGARVIEKEVGKARLIFDDDIKTILPLLQEKEITDLTITNQELEDKFMTLYEGGEIK
ncbi:macrodiolide ABC transporter ATP-binding protein TimA [Listeria seeligeri]|uniref:macrodiolide ABC transporter ATP-binding protein TimA n=1 Tax=Listeria seeligeri TaxID=1640 RepID=UPI00162A6188|nr:macrodiolide ABC transporter ATP-binding protein TimA [Listeria seeligeri]MBC1537910.1 ABC transporter ATP-binding protein [Listeria seeligeri]MBC1555657.1 ABC transporter ATP-binding protein [Listeria seeligeri]MBC1846944.1 ABC transporter ATP-binding protein [Listeria seeligeri]MBC6122331.1 ABC transporter ATP-binding protein [Listeria seeligeri]